MQILNQFKSSDYKFCATSNEVSRNTHVYTQTEYFFIEFLIDLSRVFNSFMTVRCTLNACGFNNHFFRVYIFFFK